ncbi:Hypothetical predicted protein [Drosophila guanche]|uniref:Uncharacterized protein n=1 Tax=Drosophila guanche TaxID=7266 RepID=A0A3B0J7H0_DROGU|nr:Hypothetical predicted protein [Drosophila guanche]
MNKSANQQTIKPETPTIKISIRISISISCGSTKTTKESSTNHKSLEVAAQGSALAALTALSEIDSIVNRIIAQVIRVAGPGLLTSILAGNRGGAGGAGGRSTTPASDFDADFDADFDEDDDVAPSSSSSSSSSTGGAAAVATNELNGSDDSSRVKIDLPTFEPETTTTAATTKEII